ncbi:MAG: hypothetical protein QXF56_02355 [Candidatus Micrarchaeia archaeon]
MIPEASLIESELVIRNMQLTREVRMTKKSLIRWIALALGLIYPNETRTTMLDLLEALFYFQLSEGKEPDVHELAEYIKEHGKEVSEKTVFYHLLQLKKIGLVKRSKGKYFFPQSPDSEKGDVASSVEHVYKNKTDDSIARIKEALVTLKKMYKPK